MTKRELVQFRVLIESAFPNSKKKTSDDERNVENKFWYSILESVSAEHAFSYLKDYINKGKTFAPTLSEIKAGSTHFEEIELKYNEEITNPILKMIFESENFKDYNGSDEVKDWNLKNRIDKARRWLSTNNKETIPSWFQEIINKYQLKEITCNSMTSDI